MGDWRRKVPCRRDLGEAFSGAGQEKFYFLSLTLSLSLSPFYFYFFYSFCWENDLCWVCWAWAFNFDKRYATELWQNHDMLLWSCPYTCHVLAIQCDPGRSNVLLGLPLALGWIDEVSLFDWLRENHLNGFDVGDWDTAYSRVYGNIAVSSDNARVTVG